LTNYLSYSASVTLNGAAGAGSAEPHNHAIVSAVLLQKMVN
jgi:hypothetical protein